jgi:hypothetical protein
MDAHQPPLWHTYDLATEINRAVDASRQLAGYLPIQPLDLGCSACLPTGRPAEYLEQLFRHERRIVLGLLATGGVLLMGLVGLSMQLGKMPWGAPNRMLLLVAAMGLLAAAVACFLIAVMGRGWWYRRAIARRLDQYRGRLGLTRPRFVTIEFPAAISQTSRPVTSDVGYVLCARAQRRIIVEGVLLRHIIRAEDVLEMKEVESASIAGIDNTQSHLVRIHYRIQGDVGFVIGLEDDSLAADFLRDWLGIKPLFGGIRAALSP